MRARANPAAAVSGSLRFHAVGTLGLLGDQADTRHDRGMADLIRPTRGRLIAGVCAGLANRFHISATLVRILFLLSMLLPGPQILIYIALWVIMPKQR